MSLHTARKKIDELTIDELERELECAYKLFRGHKLAICVQ